MEENLTDYRSQHLESDGSLALSNVINRPARHSALLVGDVKIIPGSMIFKDAYDGKEFEKTLAIRNCGQKTIYVRIMNPSSKAFKIDPLIHAQKLASGLSVTRKIKFVFSRSSPITKACLPIYINNELISYEIEIYTCYSDIRVYPSLIDFGELDVGTLSDEGRIFLTNHGTKVGQFSVDLGRNPLELVVRPLKGMVQPKQTQEITVEVFGTKKGSFYTEIWLKIQVPQRVNVMGKFIQPKLQVDYPLFFENLIVVNFARSYVGVKQQKNVVIKNHSSTPAMYCVMVEQTRGVLTLPEAVKVDESVKPFDIFPHQGRLHPGQRLLFHIMYKPPQIKNSPNYYLCMIWIDFLKARAGNPYLVKEDDNTVQTVPVSPMLDSSEHQFTIQTEDVKMGVAPFLNSVYLFIYGEVETPKVHITADETYFRDLCINETYTTFAKIRNKSKFLPVFCKYNKVPYVDVEPSEFKVKEACEVEVLLKIRPGKMGYHCSNITFTVYFINEDSKTKLDTIKTTINFEAVMTVPNVKNEKAFFVTGITPKITNEVGLLTDDVRFNTKLKLPRQAIIDPKHKSFNKTNDALIAFPNDRNKGLRPWKNKTPIKTIFANIPRAISGLDTQYELSQSEQQLVDQNKSYYRDYLRKNNITQSISYTEIMEDYPITNTNKLLMKHLTKYSEESQCLPVDLDLDVKKALFPPLTPYDLLKVVITPKFIKLGKVAINSDCVKYFTLENKNNFPLFIANKAAYTSLQFKKKEMIIPANSVQKIYFTYHSSTPGSHHIPVYIGVNLFSVFDLTVLACLVSNTIQCVTNTITISPSERASFLELRNPLNSEVKFEIDDQYAQIEAYPLSGVIPGNSRMVTTITLVPAIENSTIKEITVFSESGAKELIDVLHDNNKPDIAFSKSKINFGNIPLNVEVSQEFTIRNKSEQFVQYCVDGKIPKEIIITPEKKLINAKGDLNVKITVKFSQVVEFKYSITLQFQNEFNMEIGVSGKVIYPVVTFAPQLIKLAKIPTNAILRSKFKVTNKSDVDAFLTFPLEDYTEFTVRLRNDVVDKVQLQAKETKTLVLEFAPTEHQAYGIFLPYIINDILGPGSLNIADSINSTTYLPPECEEDKHYKKFLPFPPSIQFLKIICSSGKPTLEFSNLSLKLTHLLHSKETLSITNVSDDSQEIVLHIPNTLKDFQITHDEIGDDTASVIIVSSTDKEQLLRVFLNSNDTAEIDIAYQPSDYGDVFEELPIFVTKYSDKEPFTFLKLHGTNDKATISSNTKVIYLLPIKNSSTCEKVVTIKFIPHENCPKIDCQSSHEKITVVFEEEEVLEGARELKYRIVFNPGNTDNKIETKVTFSCACMTYEMEVNACSDSCSLLNFASDFKNNTYPLFPDENSHPEYVKMLSSAAICLEKWLYSQGFYYQNFYTIPENINRHPAVMEDPDKKKAPAPAGQKKTEFSQLPLVQLLINLMNSSILRYIDNGIAPSDDLKKKVLYNYVTYRNTISFLKSQGIFVPGLKPEHLLSYDEYLMFQTSFKDSERQNVLEENLTGNEFYMFSKQQWITLLFHIFKKLVLERLVDPQPITKKQTCPEALDEELQQKIDEFENYYIQNRERFNDTIQHYCESKLILWLEFHYNKQRKVLWDEERCPKEKQFSDIESFRDGMALAAVTVTFCPYLLDMLNDLYPDPQNTEQTVHNACRLVQAWKSLRLSFDIHPVTLVRMQSVKFIMLLCYLYEVLPHHLPTKTVTIESALSQKSSYEMSLQNCSDQNIQYAAILFGNEEENFSLSCDNIVVPPLKDKKVVVTYNARKMTKSSTILVWSGEVPGQKYARSIAINLKGAPIVATNKEIKMQVTVFKSTIKKVNISSPYATAYKGKMIFCLENGSCCPLHIFKEGDKPREVNIRENECYFTESGEGSITLQMLFLYPRVCSFHIYFCDDAVGDFCVGFKVNVGQTKKEFEEIILLPNEQSSCICKSRVFLHCPKTLVIEIPCRNSLLWEAVNKFRDNFIENQTKLNAWNRYYGSPLIFRVFRFYLTVISPDDNLIPTALFHDEAEYEILPNNNYTVASPILKISDVTSSKSVTLVLHWSGDSFPESEFLILKNKNELETRYYKLIFPKLEEHDTSSVSLVENGA